MLTKKIAIFFVFVLLPLGLAFNVDLSAPLLDGFHEGEYLSNFIKLEQYYLGLSGFPLLIHGAMDYLPALLAKRIAGADHVLVWTRFLNVFAAALCWVLFLDIARLILRKREDKFVWTVFFVGLFIWMAVAAGNDPLHKQQAFLGTRDLFLMLSLWMGTRAMSSTTGFGSLAGWTASAVCAAFSFYWSYDRGIISGLWTACLTLGLIYQRHFRYAVLVVLAYAAALTLVSKSAIAGSFQENLDNVFYWVRNTGNVWFMSFRDKRLALPSATAMGLLALAAIFLAAKRIIRQPVRKDFPLIFGLITIQLVFLTKLYSLPGFPTTYYFIWPTALLLILTPPKSTFVDAVNRSLRELCERIQQLHGELWLREKPFLMGGALLLILLCSNAALTGATMAVQLARPVLDEKLVDKNHYGIDAAAGTSSTCVFQWSNEGVFSFMLKRPYCTRYGYAVYISKSHEAAALEELKMHPPGLIIYGSPFWSMSIYGRDMSARLPAIDRFIRENYVFHGDATGYVFATPKSQSGSKWVR